MAPPKTPAKSTPKAAAPVTQSRAAAAPRASSPPPRASSPPPRASSPPPRASSPPPRAAAPRAMAPVPRAAAAAKAVVKSNAIAVAKKSDNAAAARYAAQVPKPQYEERKASMKPKPISVSQGRQMLNPVKPKPMSVSEGMKLLNPVTKKPSGGSKDRGKEKEKDNKKYKPKRPGVTQRPDDPGGTPNIVPEPPTPTPEPSGPDTYNIYNYSYSNPSEPDAAPVDPWITTSNYTPPVGIKQANPDIVLFNTQGISPEFLVELEYESLSGMELINISRSDMIDGQNVTYSPIKNLSAVRRKYNPNNIINLSELSESFFSRFSIDLIQRGMIEPYFDSAGNLIIEIEDVKGGEIIEAEIDTNATIEEVLFL